ncbi:unnamed protein product, partial [Vitis vinifera]
MATTLLDTNTSSPVLMCFTVTPSGGTREFTFFLQASSPLTTPPSLAFLTETSEALRCSTSSSSLHRKMRSSWTRGCRGTTQNKCMSFSAASPTWARTVSRPVEGSKMARLT